MERQTLLKRAGTPDVHREHGHGTSGMGRENGSREPSNVLTVRALSGLSGDMMLTGLAMMAGARQIDVDELLEALGVEALFGSAMLERRSVNGIAGWGCRVVVPYEHAHRPLREINRLLDASCLDAEVLTLARATFALLAEAEGTVHGLPADEVCFHEVGALDSLLDICLTCALFVRLAPARFVCSPLPLADGAVQCAHGLLPVPAPAVLELLSGVPVCGFPGTGETVTPTALALLKVLNAEFGPWPDMVVRERALVYGTRIFADAPNGAIWAFGPESCA